MDRGRNGARFPAVPSKCRKRCKRVTLFPKNRAAARAGVDLLLHARTYAAADRAADALADAIGEGKVDDAALDASLRRVLKLRASL